MLAKEIVDLMNYKTTKYSGSLLSTKHPTNQSVNQSINYFVSICMY